MGPAGSPLDRTWREEFRLRPHNLILIAVLVVLLDQFSKAMALSFLDQGWPVAVLPGFNLLLGFNTGVSFGLLSEKMAARPQIMTAMGVALTIPFAFMAARASYRSEAVGAALIVGGSAGNIVDRVRQGRVTDFLDLYWRDLHWPTFNVADIAIAAGASLLLLSLLKRS